MNKPKIHVVGAGLAGLSCAVHLAEAGGSVTLYEAAGHAGGRCRSYHDETLDRQIDNGNHLLLSGNRDALGFLEIIGAADSLAGPEKAEFQFFDVLTGERWTIEPNAGFIPWWIFVPGRRVPGTSPWAYLEDIRLAWAGPKARVTDCLNPKSRLFRCLWEPLAVAALNTAAAEGAAALLWPVIRESFGRGEAACRPRIARNGLSQSFVAPALHWLENHDAKIHFNARVRAVGVAGQRIASLTIGDERSSLDENEFVVLTVPPAIAADLVPDLMAPGESRAIVNGHFLLPNMAPNVSFMGLIGGVCHWIFRRDDIVSVTVSAAESLVDEAAASIAEQMWWDIVRALELGDMPLPPHRIVKEKRATFAQTPDEVALRPGTRTAWENLFLAGDWTNTGLPATIESAVRSGRQAAEAVLRFATNS